MIDRPVSEFMDAAAPTVTPDTTVKDLVHLLATTHVDGVAVVDGGAVVGVVTDQDLLYQEVEADEHVPFVAPFLDWVVYVQSLGSWERHVEKAFAVTAADLMTREVRVIAASDAVHEAAKVIELLLGEYTEAIRRRSHPLLGRPTVNVGAVHGGTQPNVVPNRCEILIDRRTIPGETDAGVRRELAAMLNLTNAKWSGRRMAVCPL